jgi:putative transposase
MPRTSRASRGGFIYHVLNRGNGRRNVFHQDDDFAAFVSLMREAHEKVPMRLTGYCLMTNHFHLLLWPHEDGDLSRWMQWLMTSHVRRYHRHYKGSGHVWQGRFKAFPVQSDEHYLTVLRYVERNPLRANMVQRSQDWEWSSLKPTVRSGPDGLLCDGPILKPAQWTRHVNGVETEAELKALRHSLARGTPFGDTQWQTKTAATLGLESSLRPRGRPKQEEK